MVFNLGRILSSLLAKHFFRNRSHRNATFRSVWNELRRASFRGARALLTTIRRGERTSLSTSSTICQTITFIVSASCKYAAAKANEAGDFEDASHTSKVWR